MKTTFTKLHRLFTPLGGKNYFLATFFTVLAVSVSFMDVQGQTLTVLENFESPVGLFPYTGKNFSGSRSPNDTYTYTAATSATYTNSNAGAAILGIESLAEGFTNSSAANFFATTTSGGNQKMLMSFFRRAQAVNFNFTTTGFQNISLSFELTQVEQTPTNNIELYVQYHDGIQFVSVPGIYYNSTGVTTLTSQVFTALLPNGAFADKGMASVRIMAFPNAQVNTGYLSIAIDNISVSGAVIPFSSLAPASLPYTQNFNSFTNSSSYPSEFTGFRSNPLTVFDYPSVSVTVPGTRSLSTPDYDLSVITQTGSATTSSTLHLVTTSGPNIGFMTSLFSRMCGFYLALNTKDWSNLNVSYDVTLLQNEQVVAAEGFGYLEYRVGNFGPFTSIVGSNFSTSLLSLGQVVNFSNLSIPVAAENKSKVQLRWLAFPSTLLGNNDELTFSIDNFSVSGVAAPPTKLEIVSVAPSTIFDNTNVTVVVTSKNTSGFVSNVVTNTQVILSVTGASLSGTFTGTILAGTSSATISGVGISVGNGVTLSVLRTISGDALSASISSIPFNVSANTSAAKLTISGINPLYGTVPVANQPFVLIVNALGNTNTLAPTVSTTVISISGVGVSLSGVTTATIAGGAFVASFDGISINTSATGANIQVSVLSGDALMSGNFAGGFDVKPAPSKLSIMVITGTGVAKNVPFSIVISALNSLNESLPLLNSLPTQFQIASGTGTLNISSATILGGTFAVTVSGLKYSSAENGVSISVSAASFVGAVSNIFSVSGPPVPTESFTIPQPQPLPYFQDFGTDISVWNDPNNPSESILPFGLVVSRQASTVFRTFDDADLSNYLATGFVGGASVNPATYSGGNVGMRIETRETRGEALVLALRTSGFENLKLSYTLVPELITTAGVYNMVAQSRVGSSGFFNNIAGTEFSSTASGVVLGSPINYNITLPSALNGQGVINIRWIRWHNSVSNSLIIDNISITGTKTDYLSITGFNTSKVFVGDAQNVIISAFDKFGMPKTVTSATILTITGNTSLTGMTTTTILGGQSSATVSGLQFATARKQASISANVVTGDAFGSATSNSFTVYGIPSAIVIINYQPLGNVQIGKPITLSAKLVDAAGNFTFSKTNIPVAISVISGTGILAGTTTGVFNALVDSSITIKSFTYSKLESGVRFALSATGLTHGLSDTLSVRPDAFAGITVLYSEDFEKTNRAVLGPNGFLPAIPSDMKMFNIDGQTAVTATYPRYGTDAWVIQRIPQEGYLGRGGDAQTTPTYWSNVNSTVPDSNYIAYSASWFNDITKAADRWLVTPGISMAGSNFRLNYQAKSSTSTGNFKDRLEVRITNVFNGNTIVSSDWDAIPTKNLETGLDSLSHLVSTRVINFDYVFNDAFVKDQIIYIAFRLMTPADKGDRISIDNIYVTSGGATSIEVAEVSAPTLKAMPNPTSETVVIESTAIEDVKILNMIGSQVLVAKTNSPISISGLTKGLYIAVTKKVLSSLL